SERGPLPTSQLLQQLDLLENEITQTLAQLSPETLIQSYTVQGFAENGVSILVHVVEHFSYHVGQITYFTKARKDVDTGYYAGLELG
ncbi:MAG: DinB family protein, partial [Bacteroidota bacterium]